MPQKFPTQQRCGQFDIGHIELGALGQALAKIGTMRLHKMNLVAGLQNIRPMLGGFVGHSSSAGKYIIKASFDV